MFLTSGCPLFRRKSPELKAALAHDVVALRRCLQFYADGHHFTHDRRAWDTVSGEPQNFHCDAAGTATVEDGTLARFALEGREIQWDEDEQLSLPSMTGK